MRSRLALFTAFLLCAPRVLAEVTLVSTGSVWQYLANGNDQGVAWRGTNFDDSPWSSGPAQLGWGDGDERTVIEDPPLTTYFRHTFQADRAGIQTLTLRVLRDDGVVVFLNGIEVARNNLPAGAIDFLTPATSNIEGNRFVQFSVYAGHLVHGPNTLAVELHQHSAGRDDASFDLEVVGNIPLTAPTIRMTSPTNGYAIAQGDIVITTETHDLDGHVSEVRFYANDNQIASVRDEPFEFRFRNPVAGRYKLTAEAVDNFGYRSSAAPVYVQVGSVSGTSLTRGPYLQSGAPNSMVLRWRTDWFAPSRVSYGTNVSALDLSVTNGAAEVEHEVALTGLSPDTKYYYSVGTLTETFARGSQFYFRTSPTKARPVRVWVIGDSGITNRAAPTIGVRDAYSTFTGARETDVWLMLGDNAYEEGSDLEYQLAVFERFDDLLRRAVLWPTIGNHDTATTVAGQFPYLDMFTLPTNGVAGGLASGTEKYYSFDYANIHFVCLDSSSSDRATNGPMFTWLWNDLAATDKDWIVAYWHHPPYSFGTHKSDIERDLIEMRERALPILEEFGTDLVLCGHSHVYERSFLLDGHYGKSTTYNSGMALDGSLGREDEDGAYRKPAEGLGAHQGTVYAVCGCSGEGSPLIVFPRHPAMGVNLSGYGSMVLDVDSLRLRAIFLRPDGTIDDSFTIDKSARTTVRPRLEFARSTNGIALSWPTSVPAYSLEGLSAIGAGAQWRAVGFPNSSIGRRNQVHVPATNASGFFRLIVKP